MFISCDGLSILVSMLDENYEQSKDIIWLGVDCISRVFELQVSAISPRSAHRLTSRTGFNASKRLLSVVPRLRSTRAAVGSPRIDVLGRGRSCGISKGEDRSDLLHLLAVG